jgi:4-amino-4-deoxy-L-arabinose transferase-like glycosyltransferase
MNNAARNNLWLKENASRIFWVVFALQLIGWTLIPALTQHNAPLDTVEGFVWGREWLLGTYKHPLLQAWLLEITYQIFGNCPIGYFGLSALCTSIALWAVYRTGRLLLGKRQGLIAAMLAQAILYFNFLSPEFNPNVLQLLFWALGGYAFAHALVREKAKYWLILGAMIAAGLYAKYTMGILGFSFGLFLLFQKQARKTLTTTYPYAALLLTLLLFAPHLEWLFRNNFLPFSYAASRAEVATISAQHLTYPFHFALSQMGCLAAMLILSALVLLPPKRDIQPTFKAQLLFWLAFGPLIIVLVASMISGDKLRDMWGMPFLSFIPLWLVSKFEIHPRWKLFFTGWGIVFVLALAAFAGAQIIGPERGYKPLRGHFPGAALSAKVHELWAAKTKAPLQYVIGEAWLAGNVALYTPSKIRPHVWIDGSGQTSPWIDPQKVKEAGAVLIWDAKHPPAWLNDAPKAKKGGSFTLPWQAKTDHPAPVFNWAYIPPVQKAGRATTP